MFLSPSQIIQRLNIKQGDIVCDFGCGSGAWLSELSKVVGNNGKVFALDINQGLLERLEKESKKYFYENIEFAVADVERKTYLENNFCDIVILSNILHQVENPINVILEAKRVLKQNGIILIIDWKDHFENKKIGPHRDHYISEEKLLAILAKNNLIIEKHLPAGDYHYALIVKNE